MGLMILRVLNGINRIGHTERRLDRYWSDVFFKSV